MLLALSRRKTSWAAYCDACLRGSELVTFDAPHIARFWAIERLRGDGWVHVPEKELDAAGKQDAERLWSCATYCMDCASGVMAGASGQAGAPWVRRWA